MANGSEQAIDNATRLSEIGFPEFTAQLITDTFNAITASYIDQMAQYMNVVQAAGQTLQDFINNTRDDIGADEINGFLVALGALNDDALNFLLGDSAASAQLSSTEATAINTALALPTAAGTAAPSSAPASAGALNASKRTTISQAIARRIATNKYDLRAEGSSSFGGGGGFGTGALTGPAAFLGGVGLGGGNSRKTLTVSTAKETQRDVSGSRVQVFGRVKLNFKTDLLPLAAPQP